MPSCICGFDITTAALWKTVLPNSATTCRKIINHRFFRQPVFGFVQAVWVEKLAAHALPPRQPETMQEQYPLYRIGIVRINFYVFRLYPSHQSSLKTECMVFRLPLFRAGFRKQHGRRYPDPPDKPSARLPARHDGCGCRYCRQTCRWCFPCLPATGGRLRPCRFGSGGRRRRRG